MVFNEYNEIERNYFNVLFFLWLNFLHHRVIYIYIKEQKQLFW